MATTTTNYGFDVPTSSDLVKNGATQISLLGQDLDTFLFRPFTRNAIINGGMDVWQRGTTMTAGGQQYKTADRYYLNNNNNPNFTFNQVASGFDSIRYAARLQRAAGSTSTTVCAIGYSLETNDSVRFQGKTVTFSYYVKKGSNYSGADFNGALYYGTGTDQQLYSFTGLAGIGSAFSISPTTSWVRYSYTATVPTTATEIGFQLQFTPTGTAGANDFIDITGIQLEEGNQASPFTRAGGGTIQGELAACQRYYYQYVSGTDLNIGAGTLTAAGTLLAYVNFPVTMRTTPTLVASSGVNYYNGESAGVNDVFNSFTITRAHTNSAAIYNSTEIAGTSGYSSFVRTNNASASIAFNGEL
jgi:hypothetical protein